MICAACGLFVLRIGSQYRFEFSCLPMLVSISCQQRSIKRVYDPDSVRFSRIRQTGVGEQPFFFDTPVIYDF
jgi:hypothetical protein